MSHCGRLAAWAVAAMLMTSCGSNDAVDIPTGFDTRCASARYQPTYVTLACADAGEQAVSLEWRSWEADRAVAAGVLRQNDCLPACVGGTMREYAAKFVFDEPRDGVFTRVRIDFEGTSGPGGASSLERYL